MRSQLAIRLRSSSAPLSTVPPAATSSEYSFHLANVAAHIVYRSPLPSPNDLPLFILNVAALPDAKHTDYDALLPYVLARLPNEEELIAGQGYELVFFAGARGDTSSAKRGRPGWGWFLQAYHVLSRAMRKRLQKLYIVHEKNWIRIFMEMFSTVVSPKFRKKVVHVSSLSELASYIVIEDLLVPPSAYVTDRRLSKGIHVFNTNGRRAFAVKQPLPLASNGGWRLPRVLREATSFVILDPLIKTEGIFRISPKAVWVDVLTDAYDRGQKFIVWRDSGGCLCFNHMREGVGETWVRELDQTEGYDLHTAAALIKEWYKELREPIFPQPCYGILEKIYGTTYSETELPIHVSQLHDMLAADEDWSPISKTSRKILIMHLLPLLSRITDFQDWNMMTAYNLAVCFAPCLLRGPDVAEDAKIASIIRRILMALIMHWKTDLAPKFGMSASTFEDSLRLPESVEDREDPVQEAQGPRTSLEAQISGITLVDNEESDEEMDEPAPPPLPPRPVAASPTLSSPTEGMTAVRRKPAPPIQTLPRYSMVVSESPRTLEHIPFYNTVPPDEDPMPLDHLQEEAELPGYEAEAEPCPLRLPLSTPTPAPVAVEKQADNGRSEVAGMNDHNQKQEQASTAAAAAPPEPELPAYAEACSSSAAAAAVSSSSSLPLLVPRKPLPKS